MISPRHGKISFSGRLLPLQKFDHWGSSGKLHEHNVRKQNGTEAGLGNVWSSDSPDQYEAKDIQILQLRGLL